MKPIGACIFVVYFLMIFASLVRFYVFVMPPGGSKMLAVDVSIVPFQWLGRSPSYHEVLTPVQLLLRLQNHQHHHHHTQAATTTTPQTSLAMDQEEKKQLQSIIDQLKGHSLPDGGEIVGSINLSSSEFTATNNGAHIVGQYESGSTASDRKTTRETSDRKTTRETPDRKGITFSLFRLEDLRQYFEQKLIIAVSVCILLAIILLCSIVSQLVRSSTQQVEIIVQRILLSLRDDFAAATFDNSPYERIKYQGTFRSYEETKKPKEPPPMSPRRPPKEPPPMSPRRPPKEPPPMSPRRPPKEPKRVQIRGRYIHLLPKLRGGGRIGRAQCVEQDQSGYESYDASNSENERGDPEERNAPITEHDIMQHYGKKNRKDAAARLKTSVSTFKRKCREFKIKQWPDVRKRKDERPPDQHGEGNTSTARETPLHYVQTGMEGELFGQNEVANVFQRDSMGGPIALNTESGLIMVLRPPDQHGERNTSTACRTPSRNVETGMEVEPVGQNQEANVFPRDFTYGPIALNTDGLTFPECSDAVAPSQPMATILDTIPHLNGDSSECAFQVKNQSTQFTANPYPNGLMNPHPQIALTETLSENMERLEDRRNLLAPWKEPLPEGHVCGSVNWTVRSCSDVALSQPMPTIPHTTGCSEYWRNSNLLEENDYGSINLTAPSCFDPGPSQPMHIIPYTMPTLPQMMPLLTERQDMRSVRLKATYGNTTIKFPLPSGFSELKEAVSKRIEFKHGSFKLEYKDEEGDSVLIACDEDVWDYLRLLTSLGNQVIKLFVLDKVPNTTNFCDNCGCDNCRSLKCKRP